jgi:hypothetical protein
MLSGFGETTVVFAPTMSSALLGSMSSIRSTPSVARIATRFPDIFRSAI